MKGLYWSCRMQKRKFPMIVIRVASPHFLSAPSTRRTSLLWIYACWWKLSWKPPGRSRTIICPIRISTNSSLSMYKTKLVTGKPHQFTRFFYALYLTIGSILEVSVRMVCPSCKKRRPSSKAPTSKSICDYISNA